MCVYVGSDIATTKAAIEEHSSQSMHIQEQRASLQTRISTCSVEISNLNSDQQKLSRELRDLTSGKQARSSVIIPFSIVSICEPTGLS